jgi:hypothetical protein
VRPLTVHLPDERSWLRLAEPEWRDPLDPSYAREQGGRWNPHDSFATLYLNADVATARLQIERMLAGSPVHLDDLDDEAYVLVAATLPRGQQCADAVTLAGLRSLGLPDSYPQDPTGGHVGHDVCQPIGERLRAAQLRGVWCRSASTADGRGRELAWFPATSRSLARPVWRAPLPLGRWRHAARWADIGLPEQPDPRLADR